MIIYRITNKINGKIYIGKTVQTLRARWQNHRSAARTGVDSYLARAIRKHGEAAFELQVIYTAKSLVELNAMETFFIVIHQSHVRENGYNQTLGGDGLIPNAEIRLKLSRSHMGLKPSPETRERLRLAALGNPGNRGKKLSVAHKANMRRAHLARIKRLRGTP